MYTYDILLYYIRGEVRLTPLDYILGIQILSVTTSVTSAGDELARACRNVSRKITYTTLVTSYRSIIIMRSSENHCWIVIGCSNRII